MIIVAENLSRTCEKYDRLVCT